MESLIRMTSFCTNSTRFVQNLVNLYLGGGPVFGRRVLTYVHGENFDHVLQKLWPDLVISVTRFYKGTRTSGHKISESGHTVPRGRCSARWDSHPFIWESDQFLYKYHQKKSSGICTKSGHTPPPENLNPSSRRLSEFYPGQNIDRSTWKKFYRQPWLDKN